MEQNTPKDAIALLNNATGALKLDRNEHGLIITALQILQKLDTDYQTSLNEIKRLNELITSLNIDKKSEME